MPDWPPQLPVSNRTNATSSNTAHPGDHNVVAVALDSIVAKVDTLDSAGVGLGQLVYQVGEPSGNAAADTDALGAALELAAPNHGIVWTSRGRYLLDDNLPVTQGVDLWGSGNGSDHAGTVFEATTAGAGISYGTRSTGGRGGLSMGWMVDGADIATNPLFVGLTVERTFMNVEVERAVGAAWNLEGTQNCVFLGCNAAWSGKGMVVDYGAANNEFARFELDTNVDGLEVRQTTAENGNTHGNSFRNCLVERNTGSGVTIYGGDWITFTDTKFQYGGASAGFELFRNEAGVAEIAGTSYFTGPAPGVGLGVVATGGEVHVTGATTFNALDVAFRIAAGALVRKSAHVRIIPSVTTEVDGTAGAYALFGQRLPLGQVDAGAASGKGTSVSGGLGDKVALFAGAYGLGVQTNRLVLYTAGGAGVAVRVANYGAGHNSAGAEKIVLHDSGDISVGSAGSFGGGAGGLVHLQDRFAAPSSNPSNGGILYCEAGALKYRGSGGTVTTIAPA